MDQTAPTEHAKRIARAVRHIDANLNGDLSLDALAEVAALSRFHFSRVFRAQTGEGVAEAVRRMRLNRAALLVNATQDPLADIARRCGFGHVGSFERAFSGAFGLTARQARSRQTIPAPLLPPTRGDYIMFPSDIRNGEEVVLAALPHTGPYQEIGKVFEQMMQKLHDKGLWQGSGPSFGIYYDDPSATPASELRSHAGQRLAAGVKVPDDFDRVVLSGGRFLVVTSKGPFTKLPEAWAYAYGPALAESGAELRHALPCERYITDIWKTAPEDYVTEIWVPIS